MDSSWSIYVLQLQDDKYYIGKTQNKQARLLKHFTNTDTAWTIKHKPLEVIRIIDECSSYDEDKYTIYYMQLHGIDNVRGGSFCTLIIDDQTREVLQRMITGSENKCYICNGEHFMKDCQWSIVQLCKKCKRVGHEQSQCYAKTTFNPFTYNANAQWRLPSILTNATALLSYITPR